MLLWDVLTSFFIRICGHMLKKANILKIVLGKILKGYAQLQCWLCNMVKMGAEIVNYV